MYSQWYRGRRGDQRHGTRVDVGLPSPSSEKFAGEREGEKMLGLMG